MNFKYKIALFVACLAALLALQSKVVMPFVYKIVASDLFLEESNDVASDTPISNALTELAFKHCNNHIKSKSPNNIPVSFSEHPINAWSLGNYHYVINGEAETAAGTSTSSVHRYVCRIYYTKGDDQSEINNPDSWEVEGISGLPD